MAPVLELTSVGAQHETSGLPGYPARDFFAPKGSPVISPISGRVARLSGHDPSEGTFGGPHGAFAWSIYINGDDGHSYYLTHLDKRLVFPGDRVLLHQGLAAVANFLKYGTPCHVHMGVH